MADQVTIYNLEQENNVLENDYVPVSDGNSTRKLNLSSNFAKTNFSNIADIDDYGARVLVDSFFNYVNIEAEDSGFILERPDRYILKTALYSVNKKLPGNIVLPEEQEIDYTRDIKLDDTDIPATFLGQELTINGTFFTSIDDLAAIININEFDQFNTDRGVKVNDYVKVDPDMSKNLEITYYLLTNFDSETGAIDPLVLPNAHNTTSWKYIGFSDVYSHVSVNEILTDLSESRARFDLLDVKVPERTCEDGTIFTTLPQFINSKISIWKYVRLFNLLEAGTAGTKGDEPETVEGLYAYDTEVDYGDSRFARKTLNNLKPNGNEQLYDRTTDWGDNRFAHKALDNLKSANLTDVVAEVYDSTIDYGNSRFARKNLNNLRSDTYDILNDKVPSTIVVSGGSIAPKQFLVNDDFSLNSDYNQVELDFNTYTLNSISTSATSLKTDYTYSISNNRKYFPVATPNLQAGVITANQSGRIQTAISSVDEIYGNTTWQDVLNDWSSLTNEEKAYFGKAIYKKIITTDEEKGSVTDKTDLPNTNNVIGDKYKVTSEDVYYYWNGAEWLSQDDTQVYVKDTQGYLNDDHIVLTGYNIPVTAQDWDSNSFRPVPLKSVGERLEQLESLGVYLGAYDIPGLKYSDGNLVIDNTTYYRVDDTTANQVTMVDVGNNYESYDVVSANTDVDGQVFYLKVLEYQNTTAIAGGSGTPVTNSGSNSLEVLTHGALYTHQITQPVAVRGGSGNGMTLKIIANLTTTRLPRNLTEKPGATINDYATVRYDTLQKGVSTRYIITNIDTNGNFTWAFDIYLENPERDFTQEKITYGEIQKNAVRTDTILDGTVTAEKLAFSIDSITELYSMTNEKDEETGHYILGVIDFNQLLGNTTYVLRGSGTTNGPTTNTNLNWTTTLLNRIDNAKWWVQQYLIRNYNNAIVGGYQIARNFACPGVQLMRCIIPPANPDGTIDGTWPASTSTDYRNWSWGYAQWQ